MGARFYLELYAHRGWKNIDRMCQNQCSLITNFTHSQIWWFFIPIFYLVDDNLRTSDVFRWFGLPQVRVVILKAIFLGKVKVDKEKANITVHLGKGEVDQQYVICWVFKCGPVSEELLSLSLKVPAWWIMMMIVIDMMTNKNTTYFFNSNVPFQKLVQLREIEMDNVAIIWRYENFIRELAKYYPNTG